PTRRRRPPRRAARRAPGRRRPRPPHTPSIPSGPRHRPPPLRSHSRPALYRGRIASSSSSPWSGRGPGERNDMTEAGNDGPTESLGETAHGPAPGYLTAPATGSGLLVLGHGAGGGVTAKDLQATAQVATGLDLAVALVEQPYRVAGRRSPAPAKQLDAAWTAVLMHLRSGRPDGPLIAGGRS